MSVAQLFTRLNLEREVERRRQGDGRSFWKEHSMDECVERLMSGGMPAMGEITKFGKWVSAEFVSPGPPKRKTDIYRIFNHSDGTTLGQVRWYGPWRQYCFMIGFTETLDLVYAASCLHDIATFCEKITKDHNARNRARRTEARRPRSRKATVRA